MEIYNINAYIMEKRISYKRWDQITRKWIKQTSDLKYYRNTSSNRKK